AAAPWTSSSLMPRYVAAIDQGTTSTRCMLFDRTGPVACAQQEHRQILPHPGHVEHDALEILHSTEQVVRDAISSAQAQPGDITAIGITNQRETTVVWDRETGQPLCNALVWQDTRTKEICDSLGTASSPSPGNPGEGRGEGLASTGQDRFRSVCGLPLATYFSAPKLK